MRKWERCGMNGYEGIWLLCEVEERGTLSRITLELLGLAREVAEKASTKLYAVLVGVDVDDAAAKSLGFGAEQALVCQHPLLADYNGEVFVEVLENLINQHNPVALLAGHTSIGQDLIPRLAARLNTRAVTDCVGITFDEKSEDLLMTKPVYGGNALAVFACDARPQMVTVRRGVGATPEPNAAPTGRVVHVDFAPASDPARIRFIKRVHEEAGGAKLEDADVVVSGGRGIGGTDGFEQLRRLARLLGGALGASRPPCDMGWMPSSCQVGLTGKVVAPKVYFAIAISGAMQHITGMSESQRIIAINKDENAHIFKMADYGVIGDYREILPPFMEKISKPAGGISAS
jgi:electron transfer flavoprotein alpha subunit